MRVGINRLSPAQNKRLGNGIRGVQFWGQSGLEFTELWMTVAWVGGDEGVGCGGTAGTVRHSQ